ncbi:TetR family transcriptional regulator [Streptomyces sp. NPDC102451]|uniref:TetR family transcriptional regulator n=1 Tax=Streptomyces sp. NPDC102451 TaxID=3366177 RepID=UPI00380CEF65
MALGHGDHPRFRTDPRSAPPRPTRWAGSTVSVVAERAGASRGAAQHHFPTREDLFTGAVEYVAEERSAALRALPVQGRTAVVAALVDLYTGPLFRAALQLWVAASNEAQLRPRVTELEARARRERVVAQWAALLDDALG